VLRGLQRYTISIHEPVYNAMINRDIELLESGHAALINRDCYDRRQGFRADLAGYHEPESLVV
jgi:hypothetical protein